MQTTSTRIMRLVALLLGALVFFRAGASDDSVRPTLPYTHPQDSLRISLITCSPGPEVFELYGHAAMRVSGIRKGERIDRVYNYGMFDFNSPNFIYRFVKGETDYFAGVIPTPYFIYSYIDRGSRVTEHTLNLSTEESEKLLSALEHDVKPENSTYRYKYFSNNCSTRLLDALDAALGSPVKYTPKDSSPLTYRQLLEQYDAGYPWYQLGIDIALGNDIDKEMTPRERMFNPIELEEALKSSLRADGRPLVSDAVVIAKGKGDTRLTATPWYLTPLFIFWILSLTTIALAVYAQLKNRYFAWLYAAWGLILGLAGCLVWFLTFISEHEATSPNILAFWLNPLWLLLPMLVWSKHTHRFCCYLLTLQAVIALLSMLSLPFVDYSLNPALLPLLLTTIILGSETIVIIRRKE